MTGGGPNPTGDGPDGDEDGVGDQASGDSPQGDPGASQGWIPPQERTWRHPSELFGRPGGAASGSGAGSGNRGSGPSGPEGPGRSSGDAGASSTGRSGQRRWTWVNVGLGTGVAAAVVAGGLLLATSVGTSNNSPVEARTTSASLPETSNGTAVPQALSSIVRSLVLVSVTGQSGTAVRGGVAVAADGLIVTSATALAGSQSLTVTTSHGRHYPASLVASDVQSDVAVVRISARIPSARFADDGHLRPGARMVAMTLSPAFTRSSVNASWSWDTVKDVATSATTNGMAAIEATSAQPGAASGLGTQSGPADDSDKAGSSQTTDAFTGSESTSASLTDGSSVLVDEAGRIVGLWDPSAAPTTAPQASSQMFLPSQLILGVANDLVTSGRVDHGWLGVDAVDVAKPVRSPGVSGALVQAVQSNGPAAHHLRPGDIIRSVDNCQVRSMAELRTRLYVLRGGSVAHLQVLRHSRPRAVGVVLGSSP